jgi:hypothetical protein
MARVNVRTPHGNRTHRGLDDEYVPRSMFNKPGAFGRMFPTLPHYEFTDDMLEALDAKMRDDSGPGGGDDNPRIPSGFTFLGQFIDHDITFDPTSSLERQNDPEAVRNFRTPVLELDNVYGSGPIASPHLYDQSDLGKMLIGVDGNGDAKDLPRNRQGVALIGDPRNDENLIISQLHLAFLKFHNVVVDRIRQEGVEDGFADPSDWTQVFREAQRVVRWHYQWIVAHEFLEKTVGDKMVQNILKDVAGEVVSGGQDPVGNVLDKHLRYFRFSGTPYIPVEFAVAAYRFGHSQVRAGYRINDINGGFAALLFPEGTDEPNFAGRSLFIPANLTEDPSDPNAVRVLQADREVDWAFFNEVPGTNGPVQPGKLIDAKLSPSLFTLPDPARFLPGAKPAERSLALRNLKRGRAFALPWGQRVARAMRIDPLSDDELELTDLGFPRGRAPLWFYILKEAEKRADGEHLGPVGGRIVAEVLLGLLIGDPNSYLSQDPDWKPFLGSHDDFTLGELFDFAGVGTLNQSPSEENGPSS